MKVAIVGGTGAFGRALAKRLRALGYDVHIGSRDAERGRERAIELGVQGVPTVAIGDQLFWGDDKLEEAAQTLE